MSGTRISPDNFIIQHIYAPAKDVEFTSKLQVSIYLSQFKETRNFAQVDDVWPPCDMDLLYSFCVIWLENWHIDQLTRGFTAYLIKPFETLPEHFKLLSASKTKFISLRYCELNWPVKKLMKIIINKANSNTTAKLKKQFSLPTQLISLSLHTRLRIEISACAAEYAKDRKNAFEEPTTREAKAALLELTLENLNTKQSNHCHKRFCWNNAKGNEYCSDHGGQVIRTRSHTISDSEVDLPVAKRAKRVQKESRKVIDNGQVEGRRAEAIAQKSHTSVGKAIQKAINKGAAEQLNQLYTLNLVVNLGAQVQVPCSQLPQATTEPVYVD